MLRRGDSELTRKGTASGTCNVAGEVCRALAISGVKKLCLCGEGNAVDGSEIDAHPLLKPGDEGTPKVQAMFRALASLSESVAVEVVEGKPKEAMLRHVDVVVSTSCSEAELVHLSQMCRQTHVPFVHAAVQGVCGRVFADAGQQVEFFESEDEKSGTYAIETITQEYPAAVTIIEEQKPALVTGDQVRFWGVKGMEGLCTGKVHQITVTGSNSFIVDGLDLKEAPMYKGGGYIVPERRSRVLCTQTLTEALENPTFPLAQAKDQSKMYDMHAFFRSITQASKGSSQSNLSAATFLYAKEVQKNLASINPSFSSKVENGDPAALLLQKAMLSGFAKSLAPVNAVVGSVAAHQVIIACTQVSCPLAGWFYFDVLELFHAVQEKEDTTQVSSAGLQNSPSTAYGRSPLTTELSQLRPFIVGLGGVGCNILRLCAQMGVGLQKHNGSITIADSKAVKPFDTARGGLFTAGDLGTPKVHAASFAVSRLKPQTSIHSLHCDFQNNSETFHDLFWDSIDVICCAVDTVPTRLLLDECSVQRQKTFLDAGVSGTKGSVQGVIPHQSVQWASTRDPPPAGAPSCTLANFPYMTRHAVLWAREVFDNTYFNNPHNANEYLTKKDFLEKASKNRVSYIETLKSIASTLKTSRPLSFQDCIRWARLLFEERFSNHIQQLLHNFPESMETSTGARFWSGSKRAPHPISFDMSNGTHTRFLVSAANLQASVYGLNGSTDMKLYHEVLENFYVPPFTPQEGVRISVSDKDKTSTSSALKQDDIDKLLTDIPRASEMAGYRLKCIDFECECEPVDGNAAFAFVESASQLRAENYDIYPPSKADILMIAQGALPSLETTAATAAALLCLELYKIKAASPLHLYQNTFFNLANSLLVSAEPVAAKVNSVPTSFGKPYVWNIWSKFEIDGTDMTLQNFLKTFEAQEGLEIEMLSYGKSLLYASFLNKKKMEERLHWTLIDLIEKISMTKVPQNQRFVTFSVGCTDGGGNDIDEQLPDVHVRIR